MGTYDRICVKGLGWSRPLLSLQSKSCLMIILFFFYDMRRTFFTGEAEIIIDIVHVYDLDNDWFRIFPLERDVH